MSPIPRCGCQDACSCLLVAGPGVNVDGLGTVDRPYEISAESALLTENLVFDNVGTVDFTTSGLGIPTSPLRVSANAALKLTDLTDVEAGAPLNGEVPVWTGSQWAFQTISGGSGGSGADEVAIGSSAPTPVNNLPELWVDTGTAGTGIPVSGVWGSSDTNAPMDMFGAEAEIIGNYGLPIYVDLNGELRGQPLVVPNVAGRTAADGVDKYPLGPSVTAISGALAASGLWPGAYSCFVHTMKRDDGSAVQTWYRNTKTPASYQTMIRVGDASGWAAWVQIGGLFNGQAINPTTFALALTTTYDVASLTVPVVGTDSVYIVTSVMDINTQVATTGTFLGGLSVGGVAQSGQIVWIPQSAVGANVRNPFSQTYRITGIPAGNQIFKTTCSCTQANQFRVSSTHTSITVQQVA